METLHSFERSLQDSPHQCYATREKLYDQRPWTHVEKRMPIAAEYSTPGPNAMPMPFYIGNQIMNSAVIHRPAWSMHQRTEKKKCHYTASPFSYSIRDLNAKGGKATAPAYTMRMKPKIQPLQELPGPASYDAQFRCLLPKAPEFSFRMKPISSTRFNTPAPNEYTMPIILGHHMTPPAHVMGYKLHAKPLLITPGPGAYSHGNFPKSFPCPPKFSIKKKFSAMPIESTPGPGSYCPERVIVNRPVAPRHSLGIKHSVYSGAWNPRVVGPRFC